MTRPHGRPSLDTLNPSGNQPRISRHAPPDSTPFTDAPFALQALWHKFALGGELDPHDPPATVREAYNQVVAVHLKEMRETVEAIEADIRTAETHMLAHPLFQGLPGRS